MPITNVRTLEAVPETPNSWLFLLKAVMSGKGDEIIDLAMSNLWR